MSKKHRHDAHSLGLLAPGPLDHTLLLGLAVLSFVYVTVTVRTFLSLPNVPRFLSGDAPDRAFDAAVAAHISRQGEAASDLRPEHGSDTGDGKMGGGATSEHAASSFPQSIRHEPFEEIEHPGTEVLSDHEPVHLKVPKFWDPLDFKSKGGVRTYLGNYGERLMTRDEALSIGSMVPALTEVEPPVFIAGTGESGGDGEPGRYIRKSQPGAVGTGEKLETIYVAIASYRDWQCPHTVESVFNRARHPERIRVAIVDQRDKSDSMCAVPLEPCVTNPDQALCRYRDQIDTLAIDASLAVGPVFARHLGYRMYRGEYFATQADAHVEFVRDWDSDIIGQWKSANNEMAVLTAYLSDIQGSIDEKTGKSLRNSRPIMCRTDYEGAGHRKHLRHGQQPEGEPGIKGTPTLEPYWAAGFSFGRGHFVVNVPYDQHLPMIFQGEEISLGLRGFTYGYDYYTPERSICFHMYATGKNKAKRQRVKLFWEHSNLWAGVEEKSMARLLGIIRMNPEVDPSQWIHVDEHKYGIGKVRTLQKFFDTYGIHTETKTVEQHLCRFVGRKMQAQFVPHLRKDGMGINYDEITYLFKDPAPDEKPPPLNGKRGM